MAPAVGENPFPIKSLRVVELFGHYSYSMPEKGSTQDVSKLLILYGDNGSGKTTILALLFWLLATHPTKGYKSSVAKTPFSIFEVEFSDGSILRASRKKGALVGTFTLSLSRLDKEIASTVFDAPGGNVPAAVYEKSSTRALLKAIEAIGVNVYYLSDERTMKTSLDTREDLSESEESVWDVDRYGNVIQRTKKVGYQAGVVPAIKRASEWITRQAISDSNIGEENANWTYTQLIKKLAEAPMPAPEGVDVEQLCSQLQALEARTRSFTQFGLLPALETQDIQIALRRATKDRWTILYKVLKPYIDVADQRLMARQEIKQLVERFIENLNSFLRDKSVSFELSRGIRILAYGSEQLSPEQLSSGEKQLFMLLCNTLAARSHASIFLIDEPELSLNVKWQRKLIPALLDCTGGSAVQFILASHSLQMLTQHKKLIVRLSDDSEHTEE